MAAHGKLTTHFGTEAIKVMRWTLTDADATGDWLELPVGSDRSIHVVFTAGTGTVTLQGSNDPQGTGPSTLRDPTHANLVFTATGFRQVLEMSLLVRPQLTGASGATINVYLATR